MSGMCEPLFAFVAFIVTLLEFEVFVLKESDVAVVSAYQQ